MVLVDDATSRVFARFYPAETTGAAFDAFGRWVKRHGVPRALYVDRHSIYRDEDHPEKPTQFGRAMKDLSVELIRAHSPQAKRSRNQRLPGDGRVERMNGTRQDRLVKASGIGDCPRAEMRLRNLCSIAAGNACLESKFLEESNSLYAVKATRDQDLHRAVEAGVVLDEVLCVQERRVVGNDWCVRWRNRWLRVAAEHASLRLAGRRVPVKQLADGRLVVVHDGRTLTVQELRAKPAAAKRKKPIIVNNRRWKPAADHPWNRPPADRPVPRASPAPAAPARDLHAGNKRKAG